MGAWIWMNSQAKEATVSTKISGQTSFTPFWFGVGMLVSNAVRPALMA
jgi:hypothetical protein